LILCAVADQCRVGVDVEKIREINPEELRNTMTREQWENIYFAESPEQVFFQYWAMKESVIKANGKGLSIPLNQLEAKSGKIQYDGDCWYVKELQFDKGHAAYIATEFQNFNVKLIDLRF
jgi:4'-phosphopantetheinyl transferase